MAKVYSKVNWSTNTQVSNTSLDKMDTGIDAVDLKVQNLANDGSFNPINYMAVYKNLPNTEYVVNNIPTSIGDVGLYMIFSWQPNNTQNPSVYLLGTSYNSTLTNRLTHLGGADNISMTDNNLRIKIAGYWQIKIFKII